MKAHETWFPPVRHSHGTPFPNAHGPVCAIPIRIPVEPPTPAPHAVALSTTLNGQRPRTLPDAMRQFPGEARTPTLGSYDTYHMSRDATRESMFHTHFVIPSCHLVRSYAADQQQTKSPSSPPPACHIMIYVASIHVQIWSATRLSTAAFAAAFCFSVSSFQIRHCWPN